MVHIFVTVPHATPGPGPARSSDRAAPDAARAFIASMRILAPAIHIRVLVGTVPRAICDANRYGTCNEPFRAALARGLAGVRGPSLLVDMHSFPASVTWGESRSPDAAVLYATRPGNAPRTLARQVVAALAAKGFHIVAVQGAVSPAGAWGRQPPPGENYIIEEAANRGVPAFLFEVNESRSVAPLAHALAEFVVAFTAS